MWWPLKLGSEYNSSCEHVFNSRQRTLLGGMGPGRIQEVSTGVDERFPMVIIWMGFTLEAVLYWELLEGSSVL